MLCPAKDVLVVMVTCPNLKVARQLAKAALKDRLVACANLVPRVESWYWWQGRIETAPEVLVLFKTRSNRVKALEQLVVERHPYDTPEFVVMTVNQANARYLAWWRKSVA